MSTKAIRNALKEHLQTMADRPGTAWPNVSFDPAVVPRLEVTIDGVERTGGTLKGNQIKRETGLFNVVVCVSHGEGEDAALDYADAIAALYLEGQRIPFETRAITILAPPSIRAGYPDDTSYRVPVVIRYTADLAA